MKPTLLVDAPGRRVYLDQYRIELTKKEFNLLALLAQNAERVVTHREIFREVWSWELDDSGSKTLAMHVTTLRRKLACDTKNPYVSTVRGVGYRLDTDLVDLKLITQNMTSWNVDGDHVLITSGLNTIKLTYNDVVQIIDAFYSEEAS